MHHHRFTSRLILLVLVLVLALGLAIAPARANAPAPAPHTWLQFAYETQQPVRLQGLQLVDCQETSCLQPRLLLQFGDCTGTGCVPGTPLSREQEARLDCVGETCLAVLPFGLPTEQLVVRWIGQFSDRVRVSHLLRESPPPGRWFWGETWSVAVQEDGLAIASTERSPLGAVFELPWVGFVLTLTVEMAIALLFAFWQKCDRSTTVRLLITVAGLQLLSYPLVTGFFPSLQPFRYRGERVWGAILLGVAIAYGLLLWRFPRISSTRLIFSILIGVPILWFFGFILVILFGYGEMIPQSTQGIPAIITLLISELFVFVYEALLIYRLNSDKLSISKAMLLSLLANTTSLLLGLRLLAPRL